METRLNELQEDAQRRIAVASTSQELEEVRRAFLGKKGGLTEILRGMGKLSAEDRPRLGQLANETRDRIEQQLETRRQVLVQQEMHLALEKEKTDVTLPGRWPLAGREHPLSQVMNEICDIFVSLGFEVVEGPEVELDYYNFVALNIPLHHPARDDHASFYLTENVLLRTETSAMQVRTMEKRQPPVRVVSPGRVYRRDAVDRTHSHTFHQVEGFMVDEGVTFGDLKGVLTSFAHRMFGENVRMTFRPHYFPFTEPSAEVDINCILCDGKGCPVCKQTGWLEVLGSGMVNPKVLENVGYDTERYTGFAFGIGVERLAMLKYGIDDIRLFFENDLRFLRQF